MLARLMTTQIALCAASPCEVFTTQAPLNQSTWDSYTWRSENADTARLRELSVCQCCVVWFRPLGCSGACPHVRSALVLRLGSVRIVARACSADYWTNVYESHTRQSAP